MPPLILIVEILSFTLSTPGKILIVCNISGSIKPGRIPNFFVFKTTLPSALFCKPEVKNFGIVISDNCSVSSSKNNCLQLELENNSLAVITLVLKLIKEILNVAFIGTFFK